MSERRVLREQLEAIRSTSLRRVAVVEDGAVAILAQTTVVKNYPTAAGAYYACTPLQVDGPEVEGAEATFTSSGARTINAFNLGQGIPPVGTKVIAHACGGRWTFRFDG